MTQRTIEFFINEIYSKPPKKIYSINKTDAYHIDDFWSLVILDLKDYDPESNRFHRDVLVVVDIFSKSVWTVPLKNKNAETITIFFEKILISSKRKPNLTESDDAKEFVNKILTELLNKN